MTDTNLNGFIDAVNLEVNKQIEDILSQANKKKSEKIEQAENDILNKSYVQIKTAVTQLQAESKMKISKAEQESRIRVLTHREELVRKIFANVEEQIKEFVRSDNYKDYLINLIKKETIENGAVIFIKPDDMKYEKILKSYIEAECEFKEDKTIKYGGLSVYSESSSVLKNMTIDSLLEDEKKNFSSKYKLA
ncbi:MAG: V-type ATP synthase subunit E [Oscillospiraceae bacterium]|nr:V-type ATP synthase subunit E [Oscillospiraceae bacterium]